MGEGLWPDQQLPWSVMLSEGTPHDKEAPLEFSPTRALPEPGSGRWTSTELEFTKF